MLHRTHDGSKRALKPLSLPCGHTFCEECISRYCSHHQNCHHLHSFTHQACIRQIKHKHAWNQTSEIINQKVYLFLFPQLSEAVTYPVGLPCQVTNHLPIESKMPCRWLNDKNSCPVCRKPLTGDQPQDPHIARGSAAEGADAVMNRQHNWNNDMYASEVMFRMGRLQR